MECADVLIAEEWVRNQATNQLEIWLAVLHAKIAVPIVYTLFDSVTL